MSTPTREIDKVIVNGCPHRWVPIWWKLENWLDRNFNGRAGDVDPKVSMIAQDIQERKFYEAGYRRAYRCSMNCGLAYLTKTGAVVKAEAQA